MTLSSLFRKIIQRSGSSHLPKMSTNCQPKDDTFMFGSIDLNLIALQAESKSPVFNWFSSINGKSDLRFKYELIDYLYTKQ